MSKQRIDKLLVDLELAKTRSQALQLVKEGVVHFQGKLVKKASFLIDTEQENLKELIRVDKEVQYVGRGAHKIEGPLTEFNIDVNTLTVADIGACTGGFTDFVLKKGATKVFAIDVGHGQLAQELIDHQAVVNLEGVNIKHPYELDEKVDLAVVDLSYISLKLTLINIANLVKDSGKIVALVKPQFEVGKENIAKNGIVKNQQAKLDMLTKLYDFCSLSSLWISGFMDSPIRGKTGNGEYFLYIDKSLSEHRMSIEELLEIPKV